MKGRMWLVVAALVASLLIAHIIDVALFLTTPLHERSQSVRFEIPEGASLGAVARELGSRELLKRPAYFRLLARLEGKARSIKVGEYEIPPGMTPQALLDLFVTGRTVQYSLTLLEGWTFAQVRETVRAHPQLVQTLDDRGYADLMARLGRPDMHPEGWFYPDTYFFPKGTTDFEFLHRAYETMDRTLAEAWPGRDEDLPFKTPYEALILASIVEKETGLPEERPTIAAVFVSRLKKGMRLQTDPTVIYGMGDRYQGNIRKSDLQRNTPYNTYTRRGLPPTPIAMPSGEAIRAVLHPADTDALYFVATGGGGHHFSTTYEEHRKAVIEYQLGGNASRYKGNP